jgi:hypothetical protein
VFNYLIRVKLPDRPGALGAVASRIGSVGGDVVSIDILQRANGVVVDELGVGLAVDNLIDLLRDEILEVDGVSIESVRPVDGAMPDRSTELLDVATELFKQASPTALLKHLTSRVRRSLAATYAAVVTADAAEIACCDGEPPESAELSAEVSAELNAELGSVGDAVGDTVGDTGADGEGGDGGSVAQNGTGIDGRDGQRPDLSLAHMNHAQMVLVVGRTHPVLRNRERRWISAMAELADYSWRELSQP